ncbi:hypothetical protein DL96DRAFT_1690776 [Flagelloscypha sp. PMI_526]|nr:hypothetical protein DL96DRAFT_1690776 [Flagelloscypha sp. PMI_526]
MSQQTSAGVPPPQPDGSSTQQQPQPPLQQSFNGFDFTMSDLANINLSLDHSSGGPGGPTAGNSGNSGNSLFSPTMWGSFKGESAPGGIGGEIGGPGQVPPSMFSLDMGIGMDAGLDGMGGVVGGGGMEVVMGWASVLVEREAMRLIPSLFIGSEIRSWLQKKKTKKVSFLVKKRKGRHECAHARCCSVESSALHKRNLKKIANLTT